MYALLCIMNTNASCDDYDKNTINANINLRM